MERGESLDVIVVGAGFSGIYMLHRLLALGFKVQLVEAGEGPGGTWYWNRYPGARCDLESLQYRFSVFPELDEFQWSERYATQPEILRYLEFATDRLGLRPHMRFRTRVTAATFDDHTQRWRVDTDNGARFEAQFVVLATGCLSVPRIPDIPGLDTFNGRILQTSSWPHTPVDFHGQNVGVIGTGSSGIQSIPLIAAQARHTTVFQRTACFSMPARNRPIDAAYRKWFDENLEELRGKARASFAGIVPLSDEMPPSALSVSVEERHAIFDKIWDAGGGLDITNTFCDLFFDRKANDTVADYLHGKVRAIVKDPQVAEQLLARGYPAFAKRLCVDSDYFATFNRPNVKLVNIREHPIVAITPSSVRTDDADYPIDTLVLATGFDAITGAAMAIDIRGRAGASLRQSWADGPRTYLGLAVAGFPNLFLVTGPGSPSVLSNMVMSIEQHVEWIADCINDLRRGGSASIEATERAQDDWVDRVREVAAGTLFPQAPSWYMGSNIAGKPKVFMVYVGGLNDYRARCTEIARNGYAGFELRSFEAHRSA
jgi:cyclohexanone monooxygenase